MSGKIAFRIIDHNQKHRGYIGYDPKKENWFYPKGFKRDTLYNLHRRSGDYCLIVPGCFDVLHLINIGFPFTIGLMGISMTEAQEELIGRHFKRVILLHPGPENILQRLCKKCFVKAPKIENSVGSMNRDEVSALF